MATALQEPWIGRPVPVLARGADDELLNLLARDAEPLATSHAGLSYYDDMPLRHYEARRAAEAAEREWREHLRERAIERRRLARLARAEAQVAEMEGRRLIKAEWLDILDTAAALVRGTRHEARMLPDLERDMATINGWPLDKPFPGNINRERFEAAFASRLAEGDTAEGDQT